MSQRHFSVKYLIVGENWLAANITTTVLSTFQLYLYLAKCDNQSWDQIAFCSLMVNTFLAFEITDDHFELATLKIHIFEEWKCIFALILLKKTRRRGGFLKPTKNLLKRGKLVASLQYCIAAKKFFVSFIETTIFYNFEEIGLAIGQKLNQNVRNSAKICKDFFVESIFDYETFHQMRIIFVLEQSRKT